MARKPPPSAQKIPTEEGYNAKKVMFLSEILPKEPLDLSTTEEMERRFQRYLELCVAYDQPVGNEMAYAAIGITRQRAWDWKHRDKNEARKVFIEKVESVCRSMREMYMLDGKVSPVTGIWWQKNYDGLRDVTENIQIKTDLTTPEQSIEAIRQKYLAERNAEEDGNKD